MANRPPTQLAEETAGARHIAPLESACMDSSCKSHPLPRRARNQMRMTAANVYSSCCRGWWAVADSASPLDIMKVAGAEPIVHSGCRPS